MAVLLLLSGGVGCASSESASQESDGPPYAVEEVDQEPELIGGLRGLMEEMEYPEEARRRREQGRALVQFVVGETGRPEQISILRSTGSIQLDVEAIRVVGTGRFRPGRKDGEAVPVVLTLPVTFKLRGTRP